MSTLKRVPVFTLMIIFLIATSLSLLNFKDLSWETNTNSYYGFMVSGLMLIIKFIFKLK